MKTVIEMAIEAGVAFDSEEYPDIWMTYMNVGRKEIEAFAELVRADEREACAKTVEGFYGSRDEYAAAIRARSQHGV
jgi:hypothetical protein